MRLCPWGRQPAVLQLRRQGFDVTIGKKARRGERVILTHDLDFGRILALSRAGKPGVITFRLGDMRPGQVNHYLTQVMDRFAAELEAGVLVSVDEQGIRVRSLPIDVMDRWVLSTTNSDTTRV